MNLNIAESSAINFAYLSEKKNDPIGNLSTCPVLYPYLVDPTQYPEYTRRPFPALTWRDFDYKTQFVAGRNVPANATEVAEVAGTVYRPSLWFMKDKNFTSKLQFMQDNKLFLHNIGGYGPGSSFSGSFGEYIVTPWQIEEIRKYLGNRFTGFDVGEQDGRFNFTYNQIIEPYIADRKQQYLVSQPYFDRVATDQGNWCSSLSVLWYWHYILKAGYTMLAGVETQNKITNGQVQYMHLRGAGKQYGILLYGDVSVFDTWGFKNYDPANNYKAANEGGSVSLIKRSFYTQYMYNSTILSMESGWCEGGWATNKGKLSPIGIMQNDCADFVRNNGQPGTMITQIALLNDFYSGWMPADHIAGRFKVWNGMEYEPGDFLTDALVTMLYPHYEKSGFFQNETGAMCETPYGENADALLSDARIEVMNQYPVMVAAGDLFSGGQELADKVKEYVKQGGAFIVTAENASRIWPEWEIGKQKKLISAGKAVQMGKETIAEENSYELYSAALPANASVVASVEGMPIAATIASGKGKIVLSLTGYGLNREPVAYNNPPVWSPAGYNKFLGRPYLLLNHFKTILNTVFSSVQLFQVGEGLGYIVNHLERGKYRIAVYNNTLASLPFKIKSKFGAIESIRELSTGTKLFDALGYWPNNIEGDSKGKSDASHIFGGDVRIFDVSVKNDKLQQAKEIPQVKPIRNQLLFCEDILFAKEYIMGMPTFFDHFSGITVPGEKLLAMDNHALKAQNGWFGLHSLQITADLRSGFNSGKWTFDKQNPLFEHTLLDIKSIADKLSLLYGDDVLFVSDDCGAIPGELRECNIQRTSNFCSDGYHTAQMYKILKSSSQDWDSIYALLQGRECTKVPEPQPATPVLTALAENKNHILALDRYTKDVFKEINGIECFYNAFGGVCVSSEYLASRSIDALRAEKERLDKHGITMVVSFLEMINHFPGLTLCDAVPEYYETSMAYYKDVLNKMGTLNLKAALFTTQMAVENNFSGDKVYEKMKETFCFLSGYAKEKGVKILLTNTRFRVADTVDKQKKMLAEMKVDNIDTALNLNHLTEHEYMQVLKEAGSQLKAVILGGPASGRHSEYLPISQSGKSAKALNELSEVLLIETVWPINSQKVYDDCKYMGWIK